jgi:hypothetical protein
MAGCNKITAARKLKADWERRTLRANSNGSGHFSVSVAAQLFYRASFNLKRLKTVATSKGRNGDAIVNADQRCLGGG